VADHRQLVLQLVDRGPRRPSASATLADIRTANQNITLGVNNCGFAQGQFSAHGAYQGDTSRFANIDANGNCTNNFPDGWNTVSWQAFSNPTKPNLIGLTCIENLGSSITEADTALGANRNVVDTLPSPCFSNIDAQTVMTHEWGHAYGFNHDSGSPC
jgi:hypothetical protein